MKNISIITSIINGKFKRNRHIVLGIIKSFEGKNVKLTFKKEYKQRSNNQNNYYWGVIIPLVKDGIYNEWGEVMSINEVHELLKYNCNYKEIVNEDTGDIIRLSKSTTENTTILQEEFHSNCRKLALEFLNVNIPLPNSEINFK